MHDLHLFGMDLNLLVLLDAILETRSVKIAASRVALSPSAASHALARLRDALGDPLLVRAGRTMVLTPRAEGMRSRVHHALADLAGALRFEESLEPATFARSFRIGTTDYTELTLLAGLSDALAERAPGVSIYSMVLGSDVTGGLRAHEYDLAIGVFFSLPDDISTQVLLHEDFVCVLRDGHPALERRLTVKRFAALEHVLVTPRGDPHGVVDRALERAGHSRRVARTVGSFFAAPALVARSDYVLTIPARIAARLAPELGLTIRKPPVELSGFDLSMAWHRRHAEDPGHRWLRERLLEVET